MKRNFCGIASLLLLLCGCSQGAINNMPLSFILVPGIVAIIIVIVALSFVFINQKGLYFTSKKIMRKNLETEISRAERYNHKTGLLILDVKNAVPRGIHYFFPGRTIDVESIQNKLRGHDQIIKMNFRRYKVILSQIAADDNPEKIKERIVDVAKEKEWGDVRIGVSLYPRDGQTAKDIIEAAQRDLSN